jgi:hypothetical protein
MHPLVARRRSAAGAIAMFAVLVGLVIGITALVLAAILHGAASHRALASSAAFALGVQVIAYALAYQAVRRPGRPVFVGWALGTILRFGVVAVYALLVVPAWRLPAVPALLSFVIFLFLSTLLEPRLLQT